MEKKKEKTNITEEITTAFSWQGMQTGSRTWNSQRITASQWIGSQRFSHNQSPRFCPDVLQSAFVNNGGELIGRSIGGKPPVDLKGGLPTRPVRPGGCDLDRVTVPPVVLARPVGGQIEAANWRTNARPSAAKHVPVAPLVVIVVGAHEPPRLQIGDPYRLPTGVA